MFPTFREGITQFQVHEVITTKYAELGLTASS